MTFNKIVSCVKISEIIRIVRFNLPNSDVGSTFYHFRGRYNQLLRVSVHGIHSNNVQHNLHLPSSSSS